MNLGEIRKAVERRTGVAYDTTAANEVINEALNQVSTEAYWPWLQDAWRPHMVAGQTEYSPPSGTSSIRSVTVDGNEIRSTTIAEIDADASVVGWAFEGEQLIISPAPGGTEVVQVRIGRPEFELNADGDTPSLPVEWHSQTLVNLAASIILERIDEFQRADLRAKAYEKALHRMKRTGRRARGPIAARVRPGAGI